MNRFASTIAFVLTIFTTATFAETPSDRIFKAVKGVSFVAGSGVKTLKVKPARTVKEMLFALAIKEGYSSSAEDFNWVGTSTDAWEADSTNFGETDMKQAYAYIFERTDDEQAPKAADLKKAKEAFKLLLGTGVKFGVAPMGAVQCGVTLAALAIIDPITGKIYLFAKEGSGC